MKTSELLNKDLLFPKITANDFMKTVSLLGDKMHEKGFVKDTYVQAVINREAEFPTGLAMGDYGIAIPHTDVEHVNESALGIATFDEPISVKSMINPEEEIQVRLLFLMAIKDPDGQVSMLENLMSVFQQQEVLQELENASDQDEMYTILSQAGL